MQSHCAFSHHHRPATRLLAAALLAAAAISGCTEKDAEFFTFVGGGRGEIIAYVDGIPEGATVRLTGEGVDRSGPADDEGHFFQGLGPGTYTVTVTPPSGYICVPTTTTVTLTESDLLEEVVFTCSPQPGTALFTSSGLSGSTSFPIALMDGVTLNGTFGANGATFTNVHPGDWSWALGATVGWDCTPNSGDFTLAPGGTFTQAIDCAALFGSLNFQATGLTGGTTFPLSITGAATLNGQLGAAGLNFTGLAPGIYDYVLDLGVTPMYDCSPDNGSATLSAGQDLVIAITCALISGSVTVQVDGLGAGSATVAWTGPTPGSGVFGSTPTAVTGLVPGNYTFTITEPGGFDCTPATIPVALGAAGSETALFTCTPAAAQPLTVSVGLSGFQGSPGAVPAGSYSRPALDEFDVQRGTIIVSTIGGSTFYGTAPFRLGSGPFSGWRFDLDFDVDAQPYNISGFAVCVLNTTLDGTHPMRVSYKDVALAELDFDLVTAAPSCFWGVVPANTRYVDVSGPDDRFIDINNIQAWRVP